MKISIPKPKRIPLLFFLGIGIPCMLLGYLAFRGIQNDQALLEKEKLNEHRKILELVTKSVEENILRSEQAFLYTIREHQVIGQPDLIRSMDSLKNMNPLVEEVFFSDNSGKIHFPIAKLLFLPNGSTQSFSVSSRSTASARKVQTGQQLEFQQKNYQKALAIYQQVFEQVSDHQMKGELLSSIARVQKKSTLFREAEKTYEAIIRDYNHVQTAGGVTLGLAARSELSSLSMTLDDTLTAIKTYLNLYIDLLNRNWTLDKAQYDFFSNHIKESINDVFSQVPLATPLQPIQSAFAILKTEENNQRKITERLLTFQESAASDLKAKVPRNPEELRSSARRFMLGSGEQIYFVSLLGQYTGNGNQVNEIRGLLLNVDYLRDSLLYKVLQSNVYSGKTAWIVKGRDDKTILMSENPPSGSVTLRSTFKGGFPPWSVEFYQQNPDLFETFLISRRGIYFYVFFLLAGILIFGLILTNRTVSHELELSKMKSDFVSTVSHEFKSPLSSIRQLAELLQSGRVPSEDRRRQYYDVLVEQSERLSLLIDNILDFAKIEEGRKEFNFEIVDIGPILLEIISTIQGSIRHNDFVIKVEIEKKLPSITVDIAAITQVITNLIDNAIKYSGEAKNISIRAFAENQYLIITVKDYGVGIRKEEIDKVFERFYRGGDALTRTVKGSGLGLTLVKQIVEVHNGNVIVESKPGHGSTFSIRLPHQQIDKL
jgi:signal transduction histidine kinase